jgi:acetyl-CoA carboxylase carboxyltransferase component
MIDRVVDRDSFFKLKPKFAPELVTGFAHIDGDPVGIIANQPDHVSGALFPNSAEKGRGVHLAVRRVWYPAGLTSVTRRAS